MITKRDIIAALIGLFIGIILCLALHFAHLGFARPKMPIQPRQRIQESRGENRGVKEKQAKNKIRKQESEKQEKEKTTKKTTTTTTTTKKA